MPTAQIAAARTSQNGLWKILGIITQLGKSGYYSAPVNTSRDTSKRLSRCEQKHDQNRDGEVHVHVAGQCDHMQRWQEEDALTAQQAQSRPSRDSGVFRQILREQTHG